MPVGTFENLSKGDDFLMKGLPGGRSPALLDRFLVPVDSVFLNLAWRYLWKDHVAEERVEMVLDPRLMIQNVAGVPLAFGDDFVFALELRGGFLERLAFLDLASFVLSAKFEIPVLGE